MTNTCFSLFAVESPRYYVQKNNVVRVHQSIKSINRWTCRSIDEEELALAIKRETERGHVHQGKRHSFWHLFYSWKLTKYTVTLAFAWYKERLVIFC